METNHANSISNDAIENARAAVRDQLLDQRTDDGCWVGQLSASALSTATAISAFSFYLDSNAVESLSLIHI